MQNKRVVTSGEREGERDNIEEWDQEVLTIVNKTDYWYKDILYNTGNRANILW